jgi:hypothetical protein
VFCGWVDPANQQTFTELARQALRVRRFGTGQYMPERENTPMAGGLSAVFLFDGPGQQSMLFERGVPFRYDWEAVLTPVIDTLAARPDVDASALTGYAISQGGYWIARALAFEHRLVAAVADPGVVDVSAAWTAHLPKPLLDMLDSGQKDAFNTARSQAGGGSEAARILAFRGRPYGMTDPFDLFTEVRRYQVRDVATRITTPLLITDPDNEQFFPGQPRQLYDLLPGEKEIIGFTQAQGANFHCQPTGRRLTHTRMLDWLADHLPAGSGKDDAQ